MKIKRYDFTSFEQFEQSGVSGEYNALTVVDKGGWLKCDIMTECKSWKTALRRMFKALGDDPRLDGWYESMREAAENGLFKTDDFTMWGERNEFPTYAYEIEQLDDDLWYVFLNVRYEPYPEESAESKMQVIIEDAAHSIGTDSASFAGALAEYAAIVKGTAEEYNGQATIEKIRADHPELDFMDDEQIETIIEQGKAFYPANTTDNKEEMTMTYNYFDVVKADVQDYIKNEIDLTEWAGMRDGLEEHLNDELWTADSVTGNGSGSYTFNRCEAAEYLTHNWGLLRDALEDLGCADINPITKGEEWCDVTIRCYLLGQAIAEALDELEASGELLEDEPEETA